jgi:hypothetical protein
MAQQAILEMEISDRCVFSQHMVAIGIFKICFIEVGPSKGLVFVRVYHCGDFHE